MCNSHASRRRGIGNRRHLGKANFYNQKAQSENCNLTSFAAKAAGLTELAPAGYGLANPALSRNGSRRLFSTFTKRAGRGIAFFENSKF